MEENLGNDAIAQEESGQENVSEAEIIEILSTAEKSLKDALGKVVAIKIRTGRVAQTRAVILNALEVTEAALFFVEGEKIKAKEGARLRKGQEGLAVGCGTMGLAKSLAFYRAPYLDELGELV